MSAGGGDLRALLHLLAQPERRAEAAAALADALGAQRLLLYVRDPQLPVLVPAVGMPKTEAGGLRWRAFLHRCLQEERLQDVVDLPPGAEVPACAVAGGGAALVLLGIRDAPALQLLAADFPLLAAALSAQQELQIGRAETTEARQAAAQAHDLAKALDRARAAAADLNLQLRHEHERKDEFLAMLAHELRNPLAPLVNSIELLRRGGAGEPARPLEIMARQLQQLTRLVDDLLDVSRVSRGLIELQREKLPLADVLDDAVEMARPLLEARGHELQRSAVPAGLTVIADRVRLTQVFANLLSNAAKYTDPGGRISVSVVEDQRRASVVVQDNGIGIRQEMLSRVFDMFVQGAPTLHRSQGGLGIGLTLARRLVELHGGRISAYSRGEGQGSTFTVSLPQVVSPASVAPLRQARVAPAPGTPSPRVLVVDDNHDAADSMASLLAFLGAQARTAYDGLQALDQARTFDPDLVLLDIGLPGIDGYETARRLRRVEGLHARLVALTGYGAPADRQRALDAGFDEHQVKPLSAETLHALLGRLAGMQAAS